MEFWVKVVSVPNVEQIKTRHSRLDSQSINGDKSKCKIRLRNQCSTCNTQLEPRNSTCSRSSRFGKCSQFNRLVSIPKTLLVCCAISVVEPSQSDNANLKEFIKARVATNGSVMPTVLYLMAHLSSGKASLIKSFPARNAALLSIKRPAII